MRIFIKNIVLEDLNYIKYFPVQGLVFTIFQENAEKVRDVIEQAPFYLSFFGELNTTLKYEVEELIYFCKLKGIILPEQNNKETYSCHQISLIDNPYNVLINYGGNIQTGNVGVNILDKFQNIEALVLNINDLINYWPLILKIWTKYKVV